MLRFFTVFIWASKTTSRLSDYFEIDHIIYVTLLISGAILTLRSQKTGSTIQLAVGFMSIGIALPMTIVNAYMKAMRKLVNRWLHKSWFSCKISIFVDYADLVTTLMLLIMFVLGLWKIGHAFSTIISVPTKYVEKNRKFAD